MAKKKKVEEEEDEQTQIKSAAKVEKVNKVEVVSEVKKMNKKYGKVASLELKQRDPFIPPPIEESIRKSVVKMAVITPNELARKYDIRVSAIKRLLYTMEDEGLISLSAGSSRLKVYTPK